VLDLICNPPREECRTRRPADARSLDHRDAAAPPLSPDTERQLCAARPRLLRLARALGVPAADADDVAQETLLAAWRGRDRLRDPGRVDAWLDAIGRNHCRMYLRTHGARSPAQRRTQTHPAPRVAPARRAHDGDADVGPVGDAGEMPDPLAVDPLEELDRQDLAALLDRALGHLPAPARTVLEVRYVSELPEREAAASLGVSVPALEGRLHRARDSLRGVLAGPLRAEAEAFGLIPAGAAGLPDWRASRLWCTLCGRRHLLGAFAPWPDGRHELRLRCPACSARHGLDIYRSKGIVPLDGLRSFRPALTRMMRALADHTERTLATGQDVCVHCGAPARRRVVGPDELPAGIPGGLNQHWVITECRTPGCGGLGAWSAVEPALWFHPAARRFMAVHPRWITLPETLVEHEGRPAIRFQLGDAIGTARLTALADPRTLRILATFT